MVCKNTQKGFLLFTLLKKWAKTNQNVCRRVRTSSCVLEFTSDASQTRGPSAHARRGSDWRVFLPYILWHERMCVWCMGCFSFNTDVLFFFLFLHFFNFWKEVFVRDRSALFWQCLPSSSFYTCSYHHSLFSARVAHCWTARLSLMSRGLHAKRGSSTQGQFWHL